MKPSTKLQAAFVLGVSLLAGGVGLAAPASSNPGVPFQQLMDQHNQIESAVNAIPGYIQIVGADEMDILLILQRRVTVTAKVDTGVCASAFIQCGAAPFMAASNLNAEPVRLFVQITQYDRGVDGLQPDAFVIHNPFYPAGGRQVQKCDVTRCGADWFQSGGNGLYSIFLEPLPVATQDNWQSGEYAVTIEVTVHNDFTGDQMGTTFVTFDIPAVLNVDR